MPGRPLERLKFPVAASAGRRYPELPHPYRNAFQRDRDRVVHARAFRRLEDKTQVFTPGLSDHFRNRLTHTIEVSQIARTVAYTLGLDEDLTEALALGHDVGHPPFAHSGEEELHRQMQQFGEGFDHNLHSLRIVEVFEPRYARFPGLNLTFEVREGIAKHSRDFEPGEIPELDEYLPGLRPPLEAQLIDLADEIAYSTADLDDAYSAKLIRADEIGTQIPVVDEIWEACTTQFAGADERLQFAELVRQLINTLVTGLIEGTLAAVQESGVESIDDVRRSPRLIQFNEEATAIKAGLKSFMRARVYFSEPLVAERQRSANQVAELFQYFLKHPDALPEGYLEGNATLHRATCDYIAGMTDGFFRRTYAELIG